MPAPSKEELSIRRRLVFHGLKDFIPDSTVNLAVKLCDEEFQKDQVFSIAKFLGRLSEIDRRLAKEQLKLHGSLSKLRGRTADEIGPDPASLRYIDTSKTTARIESMDTGWAPTFNALLNELTNCLALMRSDAGTKAVECLSRGVAGMSATTQIHIADYVRTNRANFGGKTTKAEMQAIFHTLYLWLCEEFGPVTADKLVQRAIKAVEQQPFAITYPPKSLL